MERVRPRGRVAVTLAGLPLTAGFASEWFLLESLMQQFRVPGLGYRLSWRWPGPRSR